MILKQFDSYKYDLVLTGTKEGKAFGGDVTRWNGSHYFMRSETYKDVGVETNWGGGEQSGSFSSFSFGATIGGGFTLEAGFVTDSKNDKAFFFTYHGNAGFGTDVGFNAGKIIPTGNHSFLLDDFKGDGGGYNLSLETPFGSFGGGQSGNIPQGQSFHKGNLKFNIGGSSKGSYIINQGSHNATPSPKIRLGGSISRSKTWIFKL